MFAESKQENQQVATRQARQVARADILKEWEDQVEKILYSDKYSDDFYEYRHVTMPKRLLKLVAMECKHYLNQDGSGVLRLLADEEWRAIGIQQSPGWEHYEVHTPEPHVLLFRRPLNYQPPQAMAAIDPNRQTKKVAKK